MWPQRRTSGKIDICIFRHFLNEPNRPLSTRSATSHHTRCVATLITTCAHSHATDARINRMLRALCCRSKPALVAHTRTTTRRFCFPSRRCVVAAPHLQQCFITIHISILVPARCSAAAPLLHNRYISNATVFNIQASSQYTQHYLTRNIVTKHEAPKRSHTVAGRVHVHLFADRRRRLRRPRIGDGEQALELPVQ